MDTISMRRNRVKELYTKGYTINKIKDELSLRYTTVCNDINFWKKYHERQLKETMEIIKDIQKLIYRLKFLLEK